MSFRLFFAVIAGVSCSAPLWSGPIGNYAQTNLVSNIPGRATFTDPNLVNPWGISASATSPFWVSDNGTGVTTLYNSTGTPQSLVVTIPNPGGGPSSPTGQVFNGSGQFNGDNFIFATENGTIAGWRGALGTTAETLFNNSSSGAIYKGLALATTGQGTYLFAADFHNNNIDIFPSSGASSLPGHFVDPNLPAGYAPFNVQNIGGQIYVTFAKQDAEGRDDVPGAGNGFVSIFDTNGNFVKRLASNGSLNSPWGLALAPSSWGAAGGDLLVGNFGDGTINAFGLDGTFVGTLAGSNGLPLVNDGLWGLQFGNGGNGGTVNSLYLTAGLNGEADGLFARIDAVPEPGTFLLMAVSFAVLMIFPLRRNIRNRI
jgi:uncharacterized protein (TIGR03118 family)